MNGKRTTIVAGLITGIVLFGTVASVIPTAQAGLVFNFQSVLNVKWGNETQEPLIPRGELRFVTIVITHTVSKTALGGGVLSVLAGEVIPIHVEIVNKPTWCTASIQEGTLSVTVQPGVSQTVQTTCALSVDNNAPAYTLGTILIRATADRTSLIKEYQNEFTLDFTPAYKPLISMSLPSTNVKEVGPSETATLPISIENLGNAGTVVQLTVTQVPKDWVASVTSQVMLAEGTGSSATAYLTVIPPRNFGYHNDEQTIQVSLQPMFSDDMTQKGVVSYQSFLIQSRGFTTPGFDAVIYLAAFAVTLLMVVSLRRRKKNRT